MPRQIEKTAQKPAKRSASRASVTKPRRGRVGVAGKVHGDAPVRAYIAALPAGQRELAQRFDDVVAREVPDVQRVIKWGLPFYGVKGRGWFVSCGGFPTALKITFFQGVSLEPVPPSGKSKQLRSIDLRSREEFDEAPLAAWVRQAAKLPGFGS